MRGIGDLVRRDETMDCTGVQAFHPWKRMMRDDSVRERMMIMLERQVIR